MYKNLTKEQRKAHLSDQDMAGLLRVTPEEWMRYKESGVFPPSAEKRLCQLFKCKPEYLFSRE